MGEGHGRVVHPVLDPEPWRVCIRDVSGSVLGAGMLLCTGQVLTCAHVVLPDTTGPNGRAPDVRVTVEFCGYPDSPRARGRIADGGWFPVQEDRRGDVALLDVDWGRTSWSAAPLRRVSLTPNRMVRVFGFPADIETGQWVTASLLGHGGPGNEWVQMHGTSDMRVQPGFSGAGVVVDDRTRGFVIGMVVSRYTGQVNDSWMLPVEDIVRYLPQLDACVRGDPAVDQSLTSGFHVEAPDVDLARRLARWLGRRGSGAVLVILTGERDSQEAQTLHRAIVMSDSGLRPASTEQAPEDTVPPVGSVDLAVDATGRTVDEVSRRIVDRIGIAGDESMDPSDRVRDEAPSMTLVVDGVDDAIQPEALMARLLRPLAERAAERDIRLLIGFHRPSSPALLALIRDRIDRLDGLVAEVAAAETAARRSARLVAGAGPSDRWTSLRLGLTALRMPGTPHDTRWLLSALDNLERRAERARAQAAAAGRRLDELVAERDELRGRLDVYRARAAGGGLSEDIELSALHQQAHAALGRVPCDVPAAAELVARYQQGVLDRLEP